MFPSLASAYEKTCFKKNRSETSRPQNRRRSRGGCSDGRGRCRTHWRHCRRHGWHPRRQCCRGWSPPFHAEATASAREDHGRSDATAQQGRRKKFQASCGNEKIFFSVPRQALGRFHETPQQRHPQQKEKITFILGQGAGDRSARWFAIQRVVLHASDQPSRQLP